MGTTRLLLAAVLASSALLACGGSDDAADSGGDSAAAEFCQRLDDLETELDVDVEDEAVPEEGQLEELVAALRDLDPPAPIAEDFENLLDAYDVFSRIEAGDEAAAAELEGQFEEFESAAQRVEEWTEANCDDAGN